ncbi:MAG: ethanolamine ammonia-lyase reactivating factor EutA [Rhodobacter sp.]|nr:ethanolamine ammonia-lyase reactivating factor EutA [Rhodobacter sp.]
MNAFGPVSEETDPGGRVFFSGAGRSLIEEDEIELTSVGVDIGSSTSHLLFSRITLERMDTRYVVADRQVIFASDILLTPYAGENTIDASVLGGFIRAQYTAAGMSPDDVDTGALILTGVAARRSNARAIGEIFAAEAGKFVSVSAGDGLEALIAAHGSGAVELSETGGPVVNIDVGGGTTKIALCEAGEVRACTAIDVGARLIVLDDAGRIARLEPFGARHLVAAGVVAGPGDELTVADRRRVADGMATRVLAAVRGDAQDGYLRLPPLTAKLSGARVVFSGGVSEFIAAPGGVSDDLGPQLAEALRRRIAAWASDIRPARQRIRATVVGASQYTVQVSGSTIFLDPESALPIRNLAVIAPQLDLGEVIDPADVAARITDSLRRMDLTETPVAVAIPWTGSATYARLAGLARGLVTGLRAHLDAGHALVMVIDGDIGGVLGMQARTEEHVPGAIVSIDGIALADFDFIDIGEIIRATGAAPVVVKSLLFPTE